MEFEYVIVGGGVAGLYTSYKLKGKTNKALFEQTHRLGGRLLTDKYMQFVLDYGPTRFQIHNHTKLVDLLIELNMPFIETENYKSAHVVPRLNEFEDDEVLAYEIATKTSESPTFSLLELALKKILRHQWDFEHNHIFDEARKINMTYLKCNATYNEKPLWTYGTWDLFCTVLSPEALTYIKNNSTFYHMIEYNLNAQTHICYLLDILATRGSSKLYTIQNGMEELVTRLEKEVNANTYIYRDHTLLSIDNAEDGNAVKLTFRCKIGNTVVVTTKRLFLCLDKAGLNKISGLPPHVDKISNFVQPIRLFKLFAIIKDPPWKNDDTNLKYINNRYVPCREIHYRYNDETNLGELLLYGDFPSINYWKCYCIHQSDQIIPENNLNMDLKQQIVNVLHRIFPENENIDIIHYGIRDWSLPPFESGVHFWKPDVNPFVICKYLRHFLIGNAKVSVCGEAFNFSQGYIESALESVEEALKADAIHSGDNDNNDLYQNNMIELPNQTVEKVHLCSFGFWQRNLKSLFGMN